MSGPVSTDDVPATPGGEQPRPGGPGQRDGGLELLDGRRAEVGGFGVTRVLPRRPRRTVGAWCFVDHMGPGAVSTGRAMNVGPHPHMGLQTVTWLVEGTVLHRDSLGSEQLIRPGELNLMTAGHGVSHSEETSGVYTGRLHGVQLWIAQPDTTRDGPAGFAHLADLPRTESAGCVATVLVGEFGGARSPARRDTDHVGVELHLTGGTATVPLDAGYEHALVVLDGVARVAGSWLEPGRLAYLGRDREELQLDAGAPARLLVIGGVPFAEPVVMWWNYVARSRQEIVSAHRDWSTRGDRFGAVASPLAPIDTAAPPWS